MIGRRIRLSLPLPMPMRARMQDLPARSMRRAPPHGLGDQARQHGDGTDAPTRPKLARSAMRSPNTVVSTVIGAMPSAVVHRNVHQLKPVSAAA
jgi:hypothetical protein